LAELELEKNDLIQEAHDAQKKVREAERIAQEYQIKFDSLGEEKTMAVVLPKTGYPEISLDGFWTAYDLKRVWKNMRRAMLDNIREFKDREAAEKQAAMEEMDSEEWVEQVDEDLKDVPDNTEIEESEAHSGI